MECASQFLTSLPSTPIPYRPKRLDAFTREEIEHLEKLKLPENPPGAGLKKTFKEEIQGQRMNLDRLEREAEGTNAGEGGADRHGLNGKA